MQVLLLLLTPVLSFVNFIKSVALFALIVLIQLGRTQNSSPTRNLQVIQQIRQSFTKLNNH
ncbi:unnamed protein product [Paramecium octaurelia]|uniref:Uncharacterized protein n=1 Tax=Paramecium octaurelia TaxID=43137 RepID=A0A8S1SN07_PAROT|nr:unnamed protein product [Paramecium octaurelia]